jgi:hypothetical protein
VILKPLLLLNDDSHIQFGVNRPAGVLAIAILFAAISFYLLAIALLMLLSPGLVSMALGAPLLFGLELARPYMFLLVAVVAALIAWGLLRLHTWARRVAALVAVFGVVLLVSRVSGDLVAMRFGSLASVAVQIILRVIVGRYLYQVPTRDAFERKESTSLLP